MRVGESAGIRGECCVFANAFIIPSLPPSPLFHSLFLSSARLIEFASERASEKKGVTHSTLSSSPFEGARVRRILTKMNFPTIKPPGKRIAHARKTSKICSHLLGRADDS